MNVWVCT